MRKLILIIALLVVSTLGIAQDLISWEKDRLLTWQDFKAKPDKKNPYEALTNAGMRYSFENLGDGKLKFILYVTFDPHKSWVKDQKDTDKLLIHEQLHFDIYELYARIFMKKLEDSKIFQDKKFNDKVMSLFQKNFEDHIKFQQKYDKETDHSKNEDKQNEWVKEVQKLLNDYKLYTKREIVFEIPNH